MFDNIRRALEPTACQVFPINLLYMPLIYWLGVFLYFLFRSAGSVKLLDVTKMSTIQMFRNAFLAHHPSAYVGAGALLIASVLEWVCAFPIQTP
jgi:hypothetical protein